MEVVDVLWEALGEEVPEKVRVQQLSRAMYKEDKEEGRKRFRELLSYLTPEMVSSFLFKIKVSIPEATILRDSESS